MIAANSQQIQNAPSFDASGLQGQIDTLRDQPGFDASGIQSQIDTIKNQPGFDASGLQGQIDALSGQPGFDDAALREMIAANSQGLANAPSFDDSALAERLAVLEGREIPQFDPSGLEAQIAELASRPDFDPSSLQDQISQMSQLRSANVPQSNFRGMAEGRSVENEMVDESMLGTMEANGQLVIERAVMAISGELSPEDSESAINMFLDEFGPEAFQFLREKILQDIVPGAQVEGKISGSGSGMDDEVTGMIGNQQPVAVSPGEYIVPADVVSGIGDGSTDAGAGELDAMLERVRMERTGTVDQPQPMRKGGGLPA